MGTPDYTHFLAKEVRDILPDKWFCGFCAARCFGEFGVKNHLKVEHEWEEAHEEAERCVHYFSGEELVSLIISLKRRSAIEADRFSRQMESLVGVDDFLLEAGW